MKIRLGLVLVASFLLGACVAGKQGRAPGAGTSTSSAGTCVDRDHDGFGDHCAAGPDCDDRDPELHTGCLRCATPNQGCDCARGTRPTDCFLDTTTSDDGTVMCHEGTRYCRDGRWSGCESVFSYPKPERPPTNALINPDAGPLQCNDCNVRCFRIVDNLDPVDGGLSSTSTNVDSVAGGGLTLALDPDAGSPDAGGDVTSTVSGNFV